MYGDFVSSLLILNILLCPLPCSCCLTNGFSEAPKTAPAPTPEPAPVAETPAPAPVTPPEKQEKVAEAVAATAPAESGEKPSAQDILAAIRNRNNG